MRLARKSTPNAGSWIAAGVGLFLAGIGAWSHTELIRELGRLGDVALDRVEHHAYGLSLLAKTDPIREHSLNDFIYQEPDLESATYFTDQGSLLAQSSLAFDGRFVPLAERAPIDPSREHLMRHVSPKGGDFGLATSREGRLLLSKSVELHDEPNGVLVLRIDPRASVRTSPHTSWLRSDVQIGIPALRAIWQTCRTSHSVPTLAICTTSNLRGFVRSLLQLLPQVFLISVGSVALVLMYWRQRRRRETRAALGELASQVMHDIRSPLAALKSLERTGVADGLPISFRLLLQGAIERMSDLVAELMQYDQLDAGQAARVTDVTRVVEAIILEKERVYSERGVFLELSHEPNLPRVQISRAALGRAVSNLLDNAAESMHSGGRIYVRTQSIDGHVKIEVTDQGSGIPKPILAVIGRRPVTHQKQNGRGLGLWQVHSAMSAAGGSVKIVSEQGKGTTVKLELPASVSLS